VSWNAIRIIAKNEFSNVIRHPIVIVTVVVLSILIAINAAGCTYLLPQLKSFGFGDVFTQGWGNMFTYTLLVLSLISLCVGIVSISGERANGSLRVLLTKPLYRKDIITGKLLGINAFLLLLNLFVALVNVALIMIAYGGPSSSAELVKIGLFELAMFVFSMLTSSVMILFAIALKNLLESLVFALAYLYVTWYVFVPDSLAVLRWINPVVQCKMIVTPLVTLSTWTNVSLPILVLMILELLAVFLADSALFNNEET
jgi:ABC-2 type transport system permease protein